MAQRSQRSEPNERGERSCLLFEELPPQGTPRCHSATACHGIPIPQARAGDGGRWRLEASDTLKNLTVSSWRCFRGIQVWDLGRHERTIENIYHHLSLFLQNKQCFWPFPSIAHSCCCCRIVFSSWETPPIGRLVHSCKHLARTHWFFVWHVGGRDHSFFFRTLYFYVFFMFFHRARRAPPEIITVIYYIWLLFYFMILHKYIYQFSSTTCIWSMHCTQLLQCFSILAGRG